jgi:hypothetical protein
MTTKKKFIALEFRIPQTVIDDPSGNAELKYIQQLVQLLKTHKNSDGTPFRIFYDDPLNPIAKIQSALVTDIVTGQWEFTDELNG